MHSLSRALHLQEIDPLAAERAQVLLLEPELAPLLCGAREHRRKHLQHARVPLGDVAHEQLREELAVDVAAAPATAVRRLRCGPDAFLQRGWGGVVSSAKP